MSQHKPYPAYQKTDVEWIGKLPKRWSVARIKRHATLRSERCTEVPTGTTYIGLEDVEPETGKYKPTPGNSRQSEDSTVGIYRDLDVLYGKLRPYLRKSIVAAGSGVCSTEFLVLHTESLDPNWLHQWLLTPVVTQQIEAGCDGAKMPRADWEYVGSIPIPVPSKDEQAEIIKSMIEETARIDALISKKSRFIELLNEKRQVLIKRAVTKGLDPSVKLKDSGVEWIGRIPEHWSVLPIKFLARIGNGSTPSKENSQYWDGGTFPWLTSGCVNKDAVNAAEQFITETALRECHLPIIDPPAVLVGITGQGKTRGMASILLIEATINQHIAYLKPISNDLCLEYLRIFLDAAYDWMRFESEGTGSTKGAITCEQLANMKIVLPSIAEQKDTLALVQRQTDQIDRLAQKTQRSIDLLKERRSAFITAAVTGQIDLREAA